VLENQVWALAEYDGRLYAGTGYRYVPTPTPHTEPGGTIYVYDPVGGWSISYDTPEDCVGGFGVYDGKLYAGTSMQGLIYVYDGTTWSVAHDIDPDPHVRCFAEYDGKLYAGTQNYGGDGTIYVYDGISWSVSWSSSEAHVVYALTVYDGKLYAGTSEGRVYAFDGSSWSMLLDTSEDGIISLGVHDGVLFAGTWAISIGGNGKIYVFDGTSWAIEWETPEPDVWSLASYDGRAYAGAGGRIYVSPLPTILGTIDIDPDTLNLKSKGKWINGYIELPPGYDVNDIDISTVKISEIDGVTVDIPAESHPTEIGDYDGDGVPDLMVKFDRSDVQDACSPGTATITVTGELTDGTVFEGQDTIQVKN
jgi:hypothetical protein